MAQAQVSITVTPAVGPSWPSSYFNDFVTNAENALVNGQATSGDPSLPSYYSTVTQQPIIAASNFGTFGFSSWNGVADPTGNFSAEYGQAVYFGANIAGAEGARQVSLQNLMVYVSTSLSPDPMGWAPWCSGNDPEVNWEAVGIDDGAVVAGPFDPTASYDQVLFVGQDTDMSDDQYFDGTGPYNLNGNGNEDGTLNPAVAGMTDQQMLDYYIASTGNYTETTTYTLYDQAATNSGAFTDTPNGNIIATGTASVSFLPEPSTLLLFGLGGLFALRNRRHA